MTVYWVVWDAAAHWVVDRLEREGALSAVTRMREHGSFAAARPARPNCQTPPSLATLFTGTWPSEHQVTGYTVPGAGEGITSHVSGFAPRYPAVSTVWETIGQAERTTASVHAPWLFDSDGTVGAYVDAAVEAYSNRLTRHSVLALGAGSPRQWTVGPFRVAVEPGTPDGPVRLHAHAASVELRADGAWQPLTLDARGHATWVACVATPGGRVLVHTGVWEVRVAGRNGHLAERLARGLPFAGEGVGPLYRSGTFGPRLAEGGDGHAEEVFLSSVHCAARSFAAATDAVLDAHGADLVVVYLPMTDDVGHELLGWCDERSAAHRPDIADRIWSHLRRCYQWSDAVLGRVLDRAGPEDTVVLAADHGMVGSTHLVHVNDHLVGAGLATAGPDGIPDASRSRVIYHPANNGSLWATGTDGPDDRRAAMRDALASLRTLTDPASGRQIVSAFLDSEGTPLTDESDPPPVTFLALANDYQPTAQFLRTGGPVSRTPKTGAHVVYTGDPRLHAVHAAVGPGIPRTEGGVIGNTEPARLVLRQLGLAPPQPSAHARTPDPSRKTHRCAHPLDSPTRCHPKS